MWNSDIVTSSLVPNQDTKNEMFKFFIEWKSQKRLSWECWNILLRSKHFNIPETEMLVSWNAPKSFILSHFNIKLYFHILAHCLMGIVLQELDDPHGLSCPAGLHLPWCNPSCDSDNAQCLVRQKSAICYGWYSPQRSSSRTTELGGLNAISYKAVCW